MRSSSSLNEGGSGGHRLRLDSFLSSSKGRRGHAMERFSLKWVHGLSASVPLQVIGESFFQVVPSDKWGVRNRRGLLPEDRAAACAVFAAKPSSLLWVTRHRAPLWHAPRSFLCIVLVLVSTRLQVLRRQELCVIFIVREAQEASAAPFKQSSSQQSWLEGGPLGYLCACK